MSTGWRTLRRGDERDLTILRIREDLLEDPRGHAHPRVIISAPDWVHVLALTPGGEAVLVRQFRAGIHGDTLEFPGGIVEPGESPERAGARELEEETGYRAGQVEHLITFQPMVGMVDSEHVVFVGRDPERVGEPTETTEVERMEWVPLASVPGLISGGEIWNAGTLVALLRLLMPQG